MTIQSTLQDLIQKACESLGVPKDMAPIVLDHPADQKHGDYSTNVAMVLFKSLGASSKSPFELAQKIAGQVEELLKETKHPHVESVQAVPPGFINFKLTKKFFTESLSEILDQTVWYGKNKKLWNKKVIIEYTDPNPFKQFHIGHLMSNAIGEALSRALDFQDAKLTRATYGGDVGLHVAKTIWGVMQLRNEFPDPKDERAQIAFLGKSYVYGSNAYEDHAQAQQEIKDLNKKIFEKSDEQINEIYDWGREISIKHFDEIYRKLGSRFDFHFYESEVAEEGKKIVQSFLDRGVFVLSEGATIFPGEHHGLHNRVFINSQGLPTYEAKELGLTKKKFELHDYDQSIVITASEQDDYYKVILKTLEFIYPEIARRTKHFSHGMMRFASGKMSSRKGNVITGESLIEDVEKMVYEKMADKDYHDMEKQEIATKVAIAAIKYTVLRQTVGKDIIFDPEKSLSFEGDSGPYLQYTYVRAKSVLAKAKDEGIEARITSHTTPDEVGTLERMLYKFPEVVERTANEFAPHHIATYLIELAGTFNAYYANNKIVAKKDSESPYKVALTEAVSWVLKNGMYLLGIEAPERM